MAIKNVNTIVRPDTSAEFWAYPAPIRAYVQVTYTDTGKLLSGLDTYSEDGLTKVRTVYWKDAESQDEFITDPVIRASVVERKAYNKLHNHTITFTNETVEIVPNV
jgi:hypothetical protein